MSELDDLREKYKDDPIVLRAIEAEIEQGKKDAEEGVKQPYSKQQPEKVGKKPKESHGFSTTRYPIEAGRTVQDPKERFEYQDKVYEHRKEEKRRRRE